MTRPRQSLSPLAPVPTAPLARSAFSATVFAATTLLAAAALGGNAAAQRGGGFRGPPEEVRQRWGNYFTDVTLKDDGGAPTDLATIPFVKDALKDGFLTLLYIVDSNADPKKQRTFEQTLFNHNKVNPGLRLFHCARLDLVRNSRLRDGFAKSAPVFVAFDKKGKAAGKVSMKGFKPNSSGLLKLLKSATRGHAKTSFDGFVKSYDKFLRELTNLAGRKRILQNKRRRIGNRDDASSRKQLAKVEKDEKELAKETDARIAEETALLASAKAPKRKSGAVLVGERRRGGRGGGRR